MNVDLNSGRFLLRAAVAALAACALACEGSATYQQPTTRGGDGWTVTTADEDPPWAPQIQAFACDADAADAPTGPLRVCLFR